MLKCRTLFACITLGCAVAHAGFDPCKFNFGQAWLGTGTTYADQSDYITVWLGADAAFNENWEGAMLKSCKSGALKGKTPVFYSYIIAKMALKNAGLQDCDVSGGSNLCTAGAAYIRNNRDAILSKYDEYAAAVANDWGTTLPVIWLMEPDFYQYTESAQGNPLSTSDAAKLMSDIIAKVKVRLPNAAFSFDVSPWMGGGDWLSSQRAWWNVMPTTSFSYRNTSGGRTQGNASLIRSDNNNNATWAGIHQVSERAIIADDGYGVGGADASDWTEWMSASNVNARIADGVIALTVQNPGSNYNSSISAFRSQLNAPNCTQTTKKFILSVDSGAGSVALNPAGGYYDSGTSITATASAKSSSYAFVNWSGACTGTSSSCSFKITQDAALKANFSLIKAKQCTLTVVANGATVTLRPAGGIYDSGSSVTAVLTVPAGQTFAGWTLTGTTAHSKSTTLNVLMNTSKTLTASFGTAVASYKLTTAADYGSITLSPTSKTGYYDAGTAVTATAVTPTGYVFSGWSGACSGTSGTCTVTMSRDTTLKAIFTSTAVKVKQFTLTVVANGGTVTLSPAGGIYDSGSSVTAALTVPAGQTFAGWTLTGATASSKSTTLNVLMNTDKTLTANFVSSGIGATQEAAWRFQVSRDVLAVNPVQLGRARLEAIDVSGRSSLLWEGFASQPVQISLGSLRDGVYVLRLQGETGICQRLLQVLR